MRLRNVKDAQNILNDSNYYVKEPKKIIGNWQSEFGNNNPIMLEIGMGKGDFLYGMALKYPEYNWIGVEKYESVLVRGVQKLNSVNLPNVRVFNLDALDLEEVFDKEVNTIYLNFSDPWPKKRHAKRRLTYRTFLKVYDSIFANTKHITLKTDNDGLFESSIIELSNYGYVLNDICLDLWNSSKENIMTEYERKFGNAGFKIKYLDANKKDIGK